MDPTVWIGKQGPTDELMKQVLTQLKTRELVKLKLLKSALTGTETKIVAENVASLTASTLVEVMGHTFTLFKPKEKVTKEKTGNTTIPKKRYH